MSKVRDLPQTTTLADNDILYAVDESAGPNGGRKITKADLKTSVAPTAAETKAAYESNPDTNAFTDAEKTKLAGIEPGATADQNASEVPYDNSSSGLVATDVQAAIDELSDAADFRPSIVSGRILHYTGGTARFDDVFFQLASNNILLNPNITDGTVYVDLDGVVKQTASSIAPPPYTIVIAKFTTDLNNITGLVDQRVKNSQNIVRGLLADVRDVRAGAAAAAGTSGRISDADHKHNILTGVPSTQIPDQANAEGTSSNLARADHTHNIPAAAPSTTLSPATTNAKGVAASFSLSDHTHAVATGLVGDLTTIQPDDAAAAGTVDRFARADHRHAIVTAAPSTTLSPATTNAEGSDTSFARNDHTHAVSTALVGDITTIQPDAAASAGTANTYARGDHRHAIDAAAPSNTGMVNTEGVSTSFARADHVHNTTVNYANVSSGTLFSTASLTDVVITGFTVTPAAGTYAVFVNMDGAFGDNNRVSTNSIYVDGVQVTNTERSINHFDQTRQAILTNQRIVTVNGSQAIDVRVRVSGGTISITNRSLIAMRLGS